MSKSKGVRKRSSRARDAAKRAGLDPLRPGMPSLDSITGVEQVKKGAKVRRIIHTNEVDAYELDPSESQRKQRRKKRSQ